MNLNDVLSKYKLMKVKSMPVEFFSTSATGNRGGDTSVVEAWLEHLGVGWVIPIADGACTGKISHTQKLENWIRALDQINKTMHLMVTLFPNAGLSSICEEEEPKTESSKGA